MHLMLKCLHFFQRHKYDTSLASTVNIIPLIKVVVKPFLAKKESFCTFFFNLSMMNYQDYMSLLKN